jgi:hypothetical protein
VAGRSPREYKTCVRRKWGNFKTEMGRAMETGFSQLIVPNVGRMGGSVQGIWAWEYYVKKTVK